MTMGNRCGVIVDITRPFYEGTSEVNPLMVVPNQFELEEQLVMESIVHFVMQRLRDEVSERLDDE